MLRHILGVHAELGLTERLLAGEAIHPEFCRVDVDGDRVDLDAEQLAIDLHFLLSRGVVEQYDESFRIAGHHRVRELLSSIGPLPDDEPVPATDVWRRLFEGKPLEDAELAALERLGRDCPPPRKEFEAGFKYVHEKSGQCLRPASPRPRPRLGPPLRAAWSECAKSAGYVRFDEYCTRTLSVSAPRWAQPFD
ncbi:MAG: hypothetical protein ACOCV2_10155 [Persicimonas sp.]